MKYEAQNVSNSLVAANVTDAEVSMTDLEFEPAETDEVERRDDSQHLHSGRGSYRHYLVERRRKHDGASDESRQPCPTGLHVRFEIRHEEFSACVVEAVRGPLRSSMVCRRHHHQHRVHFDSHDEIHEIPSVKEMDLQEIRNVWYTEEYLRLVGQIQSKDDDEETDEAPWYYTRLKGNTTRSRCHRSTSVKAEDCFPCNPYHQQKHHQHHQTQRERYSFLFLQDGWV